MCMIRQHPTSRMIRLETKTQYLSTVLSPPFFKGTKEQCEQEFSITHM